jgi:hypothetical protein
MALDLDCFYAECHLSRMLFMPSVTNRPFILSVIVLNVFMLSVIMLNVVVPKIQHLFTLIFTTRPILFQVNGNNKI